MKTAPNLAGVPETMLWTLYNRAMEARRPDCVLEDPWSIRIFEALDYDFPRSFGSPDPAHAMRAVESDRLLRAWAASHPGGTVVSLGEGLDTQALRVDDGRLRWITVDLPDAIELRARFLEETSRRRHIAKNALDLAWMDEIDATRDVFIIAQGLFMYLDGAEVRRLVAALAERFPGAELFFDVIPRWASAMTSKGAKRTPHYTLPPMPWGVDLGQIESFLRECSSRTATVRVIPYRIPRGWLRALLGVMRAVPGLANKTPAMVHARFAEA